MVINTTFRKLLYAQVTLGVIAYGVAEQSPVLVLTAGTLATLSWYIVEGPGGKPLPRWLINGGVVLLTIATLWSQVVTDRPMLFALGQFIVGLQIFKLYERKANRDYAVLIILSLMQVTCASILSADVLFGVVLAAYLAVALLAILTFQLKRGQDEAVEATRRQAPAEREPLRPWMIVSRGCRRQFRVTAAALGLGGLVLSAAVFILIPRGAGAGILGEWESPQPRAVSGFDDQVRLRGDTRLSPDQQPVMHVAFSRDGRNIGSAEQSFLLRGAVLDEYDPRTGRWFRSTHVEGFDIPQAARGQRIAFSDTPPTPGALTQRITLRARTRDALFTVYSPVRISSPSIDSALFNPFDRSVRTDQRRRGGLAYTVESVDGPTAADTPPAGPSTQDARAAGFFWRAYARRPVVRDPRVRELTESIMSSNGLRRDPRSDATPIDARIAAAVERHLQTRFAYTLDLPPVPTGADPIAAFLFESRRGHCEYFAAAMAAMLRSVGIRARVVTGYVASDYNTVGGYYVVRQNNAHAWVEAWSPDTGWRTYDPSPPADIAGLHGGPDGLLAGIRDIYDYLEFQWVSHVISYDHIQRQSIMSRVDATAGAAVRTGIDATHRLIAWFRTLPERWVFGPIGYLYAAGLVVIIVVASTALARTLIRRRRSIRQLQLEAVPGPQQRRLAEHLGFYLRMLRVLERAGQTKPLWQTPAHFAAQLTGSDPTRFHDVVPLTDLFYEIRFGDRPLDERRARLIQDHLDRLRQTV